MAFARLLVIVALLHQGLVLAKECTQDDDCSSLPATRCLQDPTDSKMRCLCRDKKPAHQNGHCELSAQPLHGKCEDNGDCPQNAECVGPSGEVVEPVIRTCNCKENFREFDGGKRCVALGRQCKDNDECKIDVNTTCTEDRVDKNLRCLCGNGNAPRVLNGCPKAALLLPCNSDEECPINSKCTGSSSKKCTCVGGLKESSDQVSCENGSSAVISSAVMLVLASLAAVF